MDFIERSGKTVADATAEALNALGITESEADIVVLEEGSKGGLFGIGAKPAKVKVSAKPDPISDVKNFIREITTAMGLNIAIDAQKREKYLYVNLTGENMGILIGKRGQTLDALQYITNLAVGKYGALEMGIVIDTENYRRRRRDTLESLARSNARKSKDTKQMIKFEPMSRYERHIIHTVLHQDKQIRTYSEGNEPYRYVVICPK